jgi:predicted nucleic acid-binding protein
MAYLVDTNILLRWVQPHHPLNSTVQAALDILQQQGESAFITPIS